MRLFKLLLRCIVLPACLSGCAGTKTDFREQEAYGPALYDAVLRDTCNGIASKGAAPDRIGRITVYKTAFREKFMETGKVVSPASVNDASNRDTVGYKSLIGFRQDLYLVRVEGKCHPDAWFYFSVWYRPRTDRPVQEQAGFGKAYLGIQNESDKTIHFTHGLLMRRGEQGYHLSFKDTAKFFFVTDDLGSGDAPVRVNRIVIEEHNKFGGPEAFVFRVADHFPGELDALIFRKVTGSPPLRTDNDKP